MNLELNFLNNSDMKNGRYEKAYSAFQNVLNITDSHAFAFYAASRALENLGRITKRNEYAAEYNKIIKESDYWRSYAKQFSLPLSMEMLDEKQAQNVEDDLKITAPVSGMLTQSSTFT